MVPNQDQLSFWLKSLKLDPEQFGEDAWAKVKVGPLVKKWTGNPAASPFTAPKPDACLPKLKFADHKDLEKQFKVLQNTSGTIGAISTHLLCALQGMEYINKPKIKIRPF